MQEQDNKNIRAGNGKGSNPLWDYIQGAVHVLCTITVKRLFIC